MSFGAKVCRMVEKPKRYVQLVRDPLVEVTDGGAAVGTERPKDALGFRKKPGISFDNAKLLGTVTHPHNQGAPDSSTTIGIVVVTDPEGVSAHLRDDGPTETSTTFLSLAHTNLPRSRSARSWPTNAS